MAFGDLLGAIGTGTLNGSSNMETTIPGGPSPAGALVLAAIALRTPNLAGIAPLLPAGGWSVLGSIGAGGGAWLLQRITAAGESPTYTFVGQGGHRLAMARWEGPFVAAANQNVTAGPGGTSAVSVSVNPTGGRPALMVAQVHHPQYSSGNLTTPGPNMTELDDAGVTGDFDPLQWFAYRLVPASAGPYALTCTLGAAGFYNWTARGLAWLAGGGGGSFAGEPGGGIW